MRTFFQWLIPVIVLVIWGGVLMTGVVVSTLLHNPARIASLTERFSEQFMQESQGVLRGVSVRAARLGLTLWPLPALQAEGVLLRTADGISLYVESCELRPVWSKLLSGEFELSSISLFAPSLVFDRKSEPATDSELRHSLEDITGALRRIERFDIQIDAGSVLIRQNNRPGVTVSGISGAVWLEGTASGVQGELALNVHSLRWKQREKISEEAAKQQTLFDRIPSESLCITAPFTVSEAPVSISEPDRKDLNTASVALSGTIRLYGDVILNRSSTPLEVTLPFQTTHLDGLDLVGVLFSLDTDSGSFNGHLDWSGAEPQIQGVLELGHFSLPRWFEFARELPSGIQRVLNSLSGRGEGVITASSVRVTHLEGSAAGMIFEGTGGVARFDKPVVALDIRTEKVNLDALFPELSGNVVEPPVFDAPPALKREGTPPSPDDLGYDIRLSANTAYVQNFEFQKPACRILPAGTMTSASGSRADAGYPSLEMSVHGYGGKADASLVVAAKDIAFAVRVHDMVLESIVSRLGVSSFGGKLNASGRVRGRGTTLAAFLSELKGTLEARIDDGYLAVDRALKTPFKRLHVSFQGESPRMFRESLSASSANSAVKTGTSRRTGATLHQIKEVPFSGLWGFSVTAPGWSTTMNGKGTIFFSPSTCLPIRADSFPARVSGRLDALHLSGSGEASLSFNLKEASFGLSEFAGRVDTPLTPSAPGNSLYGSFRGTSLNTSPVWDGTFALETTGVRSLLSKQGLLPETFPSEALRRLQLSGQIHGTERVVRCTDLDGKLDATSFSGSLERTAGARPRWKVELGLGELDLGQYMPATRTESDARTGVVSASPWPLERLKAFDLDGSIRIQKCTIARIEHENMVIPLQLQNGTLTSDPITARVYEGTAGAGFQIDTTTDGAIARLRYTQRNVAMQLLSKARGISPTLTGRGTVDVDINGRIRGPKDIPVALAGSWLFRIVNGDFRTPQGKSSFAFHSLAASGALRNGIVSTADMMLAGIGLSVRGQGSINLVTRKLDSSFVVSGQSIPDIPVRYYGSLDNPKRSINAAGVIINTLGDIGSGIFNILDGAVSVPLRFIN